MPSSEGDVLVGETAAPARTPWIDTTDLLRASVLLFLLGPISWVSPPRFWWRLCRAAGLLLGRVREMQHPGWHDVVQRAVGARPISIAPRRVRDRSLAHGIQAMLQLLRDYRPGGWRPDITLEGRERIDQALDRGRGVVLWIHRFHPFVHFVAIHRAGIAVSRASGVNHGHFYRSRLGRRVLNPAQTLVEDRYCERIEIREDGSLSHLRELRHRLLRNGVVSMYFDALDNTRNVDVPFLEGRLRVASRAVTLAGETGATLLPVFAVSDRPDQYRLIVGTPFEPEIASGTRQTVEPTIAAHARQLEPYVLAYPDQWSDWWRVLPEVRERVVGSERRAGLPRGVDELRATDRP